MATKTVSALMKSVVEGSATQGFTMISHKDAKQLEAEGFVEVNQKQTEGDKVAVRPTAALAALVNPSRATTQAAPAASASKFAIVKGRPLPPISRVGTRESIYPFAHMEVGDSFFIAATEAHPKPSRTLGSTVTSAMRRFAKKSETETVTNAKTGKVSPKLIPTRLFTIRDEKGPNGEAGAWVYRIADYVPPAQ
jgi:hypothetical protein